MLFLYVLVEDFYHEGVLNLSDAFSVSLRRLDSVLHYIEVLYDIDWLVNFESPLYLWNKSQLRL